MRRKKSRSDDASVPTPTTSSYLLSQHHLLASYMEKFTLLGGDIWLVGIAFGVVCVLVELVATTAGFGIAGGGESGERQRENIAGWKIEAILERRSQQGVRHNGCWGPKVMII